MLWNPLTETTLRVLLVEDDPLDADLIFEVLKNTSVSVSRECRLGPALLRLGEQHFDVVLLDNTLPDAEELEALAVLRRAAPDTPVLILGVVDSGAQALEAMKAGAQDCLLKPDLNRSSLLKALAYAVERQALQSESEALKAQAQLEAQKKAQFASMVSHEILNPMTGLLGFARLMSRTDLNPQQREYLQVICECTSSLSALVTDLLELSRLEAQRENVRKEPFSPFDLLEELAMFLSQTLMREEVRLLLVCDPSAPAKLNGDRVKLRQVLYNLAQNALKFTETGHVALRMRLLKGEGELPRLRFMVEDTGRGIPAEVLKKIFEPFTQVNCEDRKRGHGLGLAICTRLLDLLGSRLQVESRPGRGTIFWIDIEFEPVPGTRPPGPFLAGASVLALSDYLPEQAAFAEQFSALGATVSQGPPTDWAGVNYDLIVANELDSEGRSHFDRSLGQVARRLLLTRQPNVCDHPDATSLAAPLRLSQLAVPAPRIASEGGKKAIGTRALVVEDDPVCRAYLVRLLTQMGFLVDEAHDEESALAMVSRRSYRALTIDGHLQGQDGPTVYRRMMSEGWLGRETLVLIVSGDPDLWKDQIREDEPLHLIGKPVCPERIQALLADLLPCCRLDEARQRELRSLGPEAHRSLLEIFEASCPELLARLRKAIEDRAARSVEQIAHQLRGAAASLGATKLSQAAAQLEHSEPLPQRWKSLLDSVTEEYSRAVAEIRASLNRTEETTHGHH